MAANASNNTRGSDSALGPSHSVRKTQNEKDTAARIAQKKCTVTHDLGEEPGSNLETKG